MNNRMEDICEKVNNPDREINWGVLGCAGIAVNHVIPAMKKANHVNLYGIASRSEEKRNDAASRFGFEKTYVSYDALLEDPDIEAVYIPLPNALHQEWAIKAAGYGKHVLCEKPLALTAEGCREMAKACEKNHVKLMEAFMYRFTDRMAKVMELLDQKVIGDVVHIYATHRFLLEDNGDVRVNEELGGGALRDVGCYPVNIIQWIAGRTSSDGEPGKNILSKTEKTLPGNPVINSSSNPFSIPVSIPHSIPVTSIQAQCTTFQGVDHSLCAILQYENGMSASISCGFDGQTSLVTEVNGTKGSLLIRDSFIDSDTPVLVALNTGERYEVPVKQQDCYQLEVEEFTSAILEDRAPAYSLMESECNNLLIERILEAAMSRESSGSRRDKNV